MPLNSLVTVLKMVLTIGSLPTLGALLGEKVDSSELNTDNVELMKTSLDAHHSLIQLLSPPQISIPQLMRLMFNLLQ
jgi:hypothetical protein